ADDRGAAPSGQPGHPGGTTGSWAPAGGTPAARPARERLVVLVTDGQVANEGQLVSAVDGRGVRLFSVGIDRAVNAGLLERLARATGGRADLVESEDRLDEALTGLRRRLAP